MPMTRLSKVSLAYCRSSASQHPPLAVGRKCPVKIVIALAVTARELHSHVPSRRALLTVRMAQLTFNPSPGSTRRRNA
jgi:hypothetical protein